MAQSKPAEKAATPRKQSAPSRARPERHPKSADWTLNTQMTWWVGLVLVLPLLFQNGIMHVAELPRFIFLAGFCLVFSAYFYVFRKLPISVPIPRRLTLLLGTSSVAFLALMVLSGLFATNRQESLDFTLRFALGLTTTVLFFLTAWREPDKLPGLCKALVIVVGIQGIVGIFQFYGVAFTDLPPKKDDVPYGLMGHRTLLSSGIALLLPLCGYVAYAGNRNWKIASGIAIWLGVYTMILGMTRSAWVAVIVLLLVCNALVLVQRQKLGPILLRGWFQGMALFVAGTILAVGLVFLLPKKQAFEHELKERFKTVAQLSEKNSYVGSGRFRFTLWQHSLDMVRTHPGLGIGPGNWRIYGASYGSEGLGGMFTDGRALLDHAHNVYIQNTAETGVLGGLCYFTLWTAALLIPLRLIFKAQDNPTRMLGIAALGVICVFTVDCCFSFPTQVTSHCLWLAIALGAATALYERTRTQASSTWTIKLGFLLPIIALLLFTIYFGYAKTNFEYHNLRARAFLDRSMYEAVLEETRLGRTPLVTISHYSEPLELYSGMVYAQQEQLEPARSALELALKYNPWCIFTLVEMGNVQARLKQDDQAIDFYKRTLKLAPDFQQAQESLARAYFRKQDFSKAAEWARKTGARTNENMAFLLSSSLDNLKDHEGCATALREGLAEHPDSVAMLELLSYVEYTHLKQYSNALPHFEKLLQLRPNHPKRAEYLIAIEYLKKRVGGQPTTTEQPSSPSTQN